MKKRILPITLLVAALSGCHNYIKRAEYDATIADLRGTDAELTSGQTDLRNQLQLMQAQFGELTNDLQAKFANYDATIASLQGRVRVDMTAHFAYDDAGLREEDKPALLDFSDVIRDFHPNVLITVEGFTDPAGSAEYNKWLGQQRANAVRDYLVAQGGLNPTQVRAVSYGEDDERQVEKGAWGDSGNANRRVALVVDYVAG